MYIFLLENKYRQYDTVIRSVENNTHTHTHTHTYIHIYSQLIHMFRF